MAAEWTRLLLHIGKPELNIIPHKLLFQGIFAAGLSPTRAYMMAAGIPGRPRKQTWFRWAQEFMRPLQNRERLPGLSEGQYVPSQWKTMVRYTEERTKFRAVYEFKYIDPTTGQEITDYFSVRSDEERPVGWYARHAEQKVLEIEESIHVDIIEWRLCDFRERV
ncbi:MAG: hypothetical protein DDT19_01773 [Syntrophomonadaceae bacterium]|nr:hypothetical protein [Bacillota bacterium]